MKNCKMRNGIGRGTDINHLIKIEENQEIKMLRNRIIGEITIKINMRKEIEIEGIIIIKAGKMTDIEIKEMIIGEMTEDLLKIGEIQRSIEMTTTIIKIGEEIGEITTGMQIGMETCFDKLF